jgi:hypothetical protein
MFYTVFEMDVIVLNCSTNTSTQHYILDTESIDK